MNMANLVSDIMKEIVICPGCGMVSISPIEECSSCEYENGRFPFRLLTISEIIEIDHGDFNDVNLHKFIVSLLKLLSVGD